MKKKIYVTHSAHLDLFWMGTMEQCMADGAKIIDDALQDLLSNPDRYFVIESVRFLEYYLWQNPDKTEAVKKLLETGQLEIGACYTDRLENHHDGESLVRNVIYGKDMLRKLTGHDTRIATHPDLPGLTEQTPQIYKKAQVEYYLFARGYYDGGRFLWKGLDDSYITAYNYPIHYTYYDFNKLMERIPQVEESIKSDVILISCSAGDLGTYDSFMLPTNEHVNLTSMLDTYNEEDHPYELIRGNVYETLLKMPQASLPVNYGESPCRWGTYGSATNVTSFRQEKELSARLTDAEKIVSMCSLRGIDCSSLQVAHPFQKTASSHDIRKYFDKKEAPATLNEWIDFAWRLQLVTQDHNYGGIGGITSDFDRSVFRTCACEILDSIIEFCIQKLADHFGSEGEIVIFNTLNWTRTHKISVNTDLNSQNSYAAVDHEGNYFPIVNDSVQPYFEASIPGFGYKCFHLEQTSDRSHSGIISETDGEIIMENYYYRLTVDKKSGAVSSIMDKEENQELVGDTLIGIIDAYEDYSVDVHEELYDKKLIDSTGSAQKKFIWGENELYTWIRITSEICDSKVELEIKLNKFEKEIAILPIIHWTGMEHTQLRMHLGLAPELTAIYYGVPYGIQKFGHYMEGAYPANPSDEISDSLFEEYREVQGWFALENENSGISISTNHSSFAFKQRNNVEAVLIRTVQSCGDSDVVIPNHGRQTFKFHLTSYRNTSVTRDDSFYKKSWSCQHPFYSALADTSVSTLPSSGSLLEFCESGILSVLREEGGHYTARLFSVNSTPGKLFVKHNGQELELEPVDLLGNPYEEDDTLAFGDIKTVSFSCHSE